MTAQDELPDDTFMPYFRQDMSVNSEQSTASARWATMQETGQYVYDPDENIWLGTFVKIQDWTQPPPHDRL